MTCWSGTGKRVADETLGQEAARLIREAREVLADPAKTEYHERLSAAVDRLQDDLDFWGQLRAVTDVVDIANERVVD